MKESGENYLETILMLSEKSEYVRAVDVAEALGYSKPSVSRAMGILSESGLISADKRGIRLTEAGRLAANAIYERHYMITRFLIKALGVDEETAEQDACRIEHVISTETFSKIKEYIGRTE